MVVLASLGVNLIADGATFSFGIIYVELVDYFEGSRGYTAWIGGLLMAIPLLSGPLASSLTDRYGCRRVTIAGSLLSALGFLLSSVSDSLEVGLHRPPPPPPTARSTGTGTVNLT